jgi:hypothetical protein
MDAYQKGFTGAQAAWAAKQYKGHWKVSKNIMAEYNFAHQTTSTTTWFILSR